jgi:two-component SAPR family response regulator
MQARLSNDEDARLRAWQRAIDMYRGSFLQGHDDPWILERREEFRSGYIEALTNVAREWRKMEQDEKALALLHKAVEADYTREDIHRELLQLYSDMGRRSEAVKHYKKLVETLEADEQTPSSETSALYEAITATA